MSRMRPFLVVALLTALVVGCAQPRKDPTAPVARPADTDPAVAAERRAQEESAVRAHLAGYRRLQRVSYSLLRTAAPNCLDRRRMSIGVTPIDSGIFQKAVRPTAERLLGLQAGRGLAFYSVPSNTPAYRAGIREGDVLISVQAKEFRAGSTGMFDLERWVDSLPRGQNVQVQVRRKDQTLQYDVATEMVCDHRLLFDATDIVNAINLFDTTVVYGGIPRVMDRDQDLAIVLAHEIAHGLLRHSARTVQGIIDRNPVTPVQQIQAELEADEMGMRLAAAAGYDVSHAEETMRKMAQAAPSAIYLATSHPTSPERFVALKRLVEDVASRRKRGDSLFVDQRRMPTYFDGALDLTAAQFQLLATKVPWIDMPPRGRMNTSRFNLADGADPRLTAWADVPTLDADGLVAYQEFLRDSRRPRAFALSPQGSWGAGFGAHAVTDAETACKGQDAATCYIYAENERVAISAAQIATLHESLAQKYKPPVTAARALGHTRQVPPASGFAEARDLDAVPVLPQFRKAYAEYLTKARPSAFAIKENGAYRYIVGSADAMERLLGDCERAGEVCWLYAVDDNVVWQRDLTKRVSSIRQLKPVAVSTAAP